MRIEKNKNLQALNTLAVPSRAEFFTAVRSIEELKEALSWAREQKVKVQVLGGGSNVLLADHVPGLTINIAIRGREISSANATHRVILSAGENWHSSVEWMLAKRCNGLENLALIPGTVGAAPVQNIGAYGVELADYFYRLSAVNIHNLEQVEFSKSDCAFAYRDSVFKSSEKPNWVITEVEFSLPHNSDIRVNYPALKQALNDSSVSIVNAKTVFDTVCAIRASKLPAPEDIPNAGSFFKNPVVPKNKFEKLNKEWPGIVAFELTEGLYKLAAGWLIDNAGWKGKLKNGCQMHHQQALVLCNPQRKATSEILKFAAEVQSDIKTKYDVDLEIEPQLMGE